jgi:hypothetical protein
VSLPFDIEDVLKSAGQGGWEWFDQVADPRIREQIELRKAKAAEDRRTIAGAWAAFAATPDGKMALEALFATTLLRTAYFVGLGTDALQVAQFGAFREGQNAVAHEIARQIVAGRESEEQLKPRDI